MSVNFGGQLDDFQEQLKQIAANQPSSNIELVTPYDRQTATVPTNAQNNTQGDPWANYYVNNIVPQIQSQGRPQSYMEQRDTDISLRGLVRNAARDAEQLGTGLVHAGLDPWGTAKAIGSGLYNYYSGMQDMDLLHRGVHGATDLVGDVLLSGITSGKELRDVLTGRTSIPKFLGNTAMNVYQHPVESALSIGALVPAAKAANVTAKTARASQRAEAIVNVSSQKVKAQANKIIDKGKKLAKNYTEDQIAKANEILRVGAEAPEELKQVTKEVGKIYDEYDSLIDKRYHNWISKEEKFSVADSQAAQATERALGDTSRSFQEIQKERKVYTDLLKDEEGMKILNEQAKAGDTIAQEVLNNKMLFDKGYLKIIPQAGIKDIEKAGQVISKERGYFGRASQRVYGTATDAQVAKTIGKNVVEWMQEQTGDLVKGELAKQIREGTLGKELLVNDTTKEVNYIPKAALDTGDLENALKNVQKETPVNPNDFVAIDKDLVTELNNQLENYIKGSNPFSEGALADFQNVKKGTILANLGYLVGNAQTGLFNMALNEGLNPIAWAQDIGAAIQSGGRLSKQIGTYRFMEPMTNKMTTKVGKGLAWFNSKFGGDLSGIADAKLQNIFSEIAINNNLRSRGIKAADRLKFLEGAGINDMNNIIKDTQMVSLLNPTKTILPKSMHKMAALVSPFWRWTDTAAQSALHMYRKNPLLSTYLVMDTLGKVGFDQEMQNRFNLKVDLDKPFVSYRFNPRTGNPEEVSMEFAPVMNTLKFSSKLLESMSKGKNGLGRGDAATLPTVSAFLGAFNGVDAFGNPIKRTDLDNKHLKDMMAIQGKERYKWDPETHGFKKMEGFELDEVAVVTAENLIGARSLLNKTILPAAASAVSAISGQPYNYYQPYGNSLLGQFGSNPDEIIAKRNMPFLMGGDPTKPTGTPEVLNKLRGQYTTPYFEEKGPSKSLNKALLRSNIRRGMRADQLMRGGY